MIIHSNNKNSTQQQQQHKSQITNNHQQSKSDQISVQPDSKRSQEDSNTTTKREMDRPLTLIIDCLYYILVGRGRSLISILKLILIQKEERERG